MPKTQTVHVLRWWDRHNDETSVHATRAGAIASLAAVARQCGDVPGNLADDAAIWAWAGDRQGDRGYDLAEYEIEPG